MVESDGGSMSIPVANKYRDFHILEHRPYTGYFKKEYSITGNVDILCLGSCDLQSIRPVGIDKFFWVDYLFEEYAGECLNKIVDYKNLHEFVEFYLKTYKTPRTICYTMSMMSETVVINNQLFIVTENSARTIQYLYIKEFFTEEQKDELMGIVAKLKFVDKKSRIDYSVNSINSMHELCKQFDVQLLWTTNGTKTANNFYRDIMSDILDNVACKDGHVGWVENEDAQPDSSMGPKTQYAIYSRYKLFL